MTCNKVMINNAVIFNVNDNNLTPATSTGETVLLNLPTARCLQLLLERKGVVVSRDDFLEHVWGARGIVVSQNTFYQNISLLRKSLKRAGLQEDIIVTVKRKGFTLFPDVILEITETCEEGISTKPLASLSSIGAERNMTSDKSVSAPGLLPSHGIPKWLTLILAVILVLELIICVGFFYNNLQD